MTVKNTVARSGRSAGGSACLIIGAAVFFVSTAAVAQSAPPDPERERDATRFGGFVQGGIQIGAAPGQTSVLPGLFVRGGPRYGVVHAAGELMLSIGPSTKAGFAVFAGAFGTVGVHTPAEGKVTPFAELHFGPMFFHRESPGQTDASGLWGGVSVGVAGYDRVGSSAGGFVAATAFTPLSKPSRNTGDVADVVVPLLLRAGVALR